MAKSKKKSFISVYENPKDSKFYVAEYLKDSDHEWELLEVKKQIKGVEKKEDAEIRAKSFATAQKLPYNDLNDDILVDKIVEEQAAKVFEMAVSNSDIDEFLEIIAEDVVDNAEVVFSSGHVCHIKKEDNKSIWDYSYKSDYSDNPYHLLKALIHLLAINKGSVMAKSYLKEIHSNGKPITEVRGWTFIYDNDDLIVQQAKAEEMFVNINTNSNGQMLLPDAEVIYCDEHGTRYNPILNPAKEKENKSDDSK